MLKLKTYVYKPRWELKIGLAILIALSVFSVVLVTVNYGEVRRPGRALGDSIAILALATTAMISTLGTYKEVRWIMSPRSVFISVALCAIPATAAISFFLMIGPHETTRLAMQAGIGISVTLVLMVILLVAYIGAMLVTIPLSSREISKQAYLDFKEKNIKESKQKQ